MWDQLGGVEIGTLTPMWVSHLLPWMLLVILKLQGSLVKGPIRRGGAFGCLLVNNYSAARLDNIVTLTISTF